MMLLLQVILFFASLFCSFIRASPIPDNLTVTISDGTIRGTTYTTGNGKTYYGFQGIPFAIPPLGELRLEPAQPVKPWDGILDTTQESKGCITDGYLSHPDVESEDCLYLNVFVPNVESTETLPVMVWIYGGAFVSGSASKYYYGPDFLIEKDVIVVTLNYRLNVFGFISTEDSNLPGNLGLKDQNLALKWVQKNIGYFGGDAEKVTLFGQSAGGTSVGLHLISKQSKGLFRAAILESGSALVTWSVDWVAKQLAFKIGNNIPNADFGDDSKALKDFLKNRTVEEIMTAYTEAVSGIDHIYPTIELESEDAFVSESHYELVVSGDFNQVPILVGVCSEESLMGLKNLNNARKIGQGFDNIPETTIPNDLRPNSSDTTIVAQEIKNIYFQENELYAENLVGLAEYYSDNRYTRGVIKQAELSSKFVPVYFYEFAYYGRPITKAFIPGAERAGHAAELPFLFNRTGSSSDIDEDLLTQNRIVTLWTNFAKYLNPTPIKDELFQNLTWPTATPENLQYLSINNTLEIRSHFKKESYAKWNQIYEKYGAKPYITF
ncbi:juvenile hormone esterase-like [Anthonomus grandis grandis]|uniref:juvenile hormone esterase-like n=1 Tax=Anthonomus grandis grandis TaxID=2921223 RepID=UPI002165EE87|nr:juvenile hormone esterase-like [Anthonomus grandis grandis]